MRTLSIWVAAACCSVVFGCAPAEPESCGELVWLDPHNPASASNPFTYPLGRVFACVERSHVIELRNVGDCAVDLEPFERDPVDDLQFQVVAESRRIEPGKAVPVRVTTRPGITEDEVAATVVARGSRGESATLTLKMQPFQGGHTLPTNAIDFGAVALGESVELGLPLRNPTAQPIRYGVRIPQSGSYPGAFSLSPGSPSGEFELGPDELRDVIVRFQPTEQGAHLGTMALKLPPCGVDANLRLSGRGVNNVLTVEPQITDFRCVAPGLEERRSITFSNLQAKPVRLTQIKSLDPSEFQIVSPTDGTLEIPAATRDSNGDWIPGTATIEVSFTPIQLGLHQAQLQFATDLPKQPSGFITLKGGGCGGSSPTIRTSQSPR